MSLSNLPRELLLDIADYLDNAELNSLACTNSNLYNLLNKQLYRQDLARQLSRSVAWASENGVEDTIKRAVDANRCFNPIPESFCVALQIAAYLGHVRIVELLLKVDGQDPNIVYHRGEHALGYATRSTSPRRDCVVRLLLNHPDIDVNRRNDLEGRTALFHTARDGPYLEVAKLLLEREDTDIT